MAIVATNGPATVGGLAAYLRGLTTELGNHGRVPVVVRFNERSTVALSYTRREHRREDVSPTTVTRVIAPASTALPTLAAARRLMYQPRTQRLAAGLFARAFRSQLDAAIPQTVELVHVIGTAWEMLGPTVLPLARRRGAAITALPAIHPGSWGDSRFDARFYGELDAVLALSSVERDRLVQIGIDASRVHVTGLAPNPAPTGDGARFRIRRHLVDRPIVLFIGRKQRYKGYHCLLEAMTAVRRSIPDACLVAVGADAEPPYPRIEPDALVDLGACDEQEKADALAAADVYCMPSAGESFGIGFVEAWSYGLPVIGGPAPAVRELIQEGRDGLHVEQEPSAVAAAIVKLLRDPELRRAMGEAGRTRQRASFSWSAIAAAHRAVFAEAFVSEARRRLDR